MRVNQVTTARIRLGIHMPGTACRAAMSHPALKIQGGTSRELPAKNQ